MNRSTPAARAAAIRLSVPSVRSRFVGSNVSAKRFKSLPSASAVAWWTIASGFVSSTSRRAASRSSTSSTAGSPPSRRSVSARSCVRDVPTTSCPRSTSWDTSGNPTAPVAPMTRTFISSSFRVTA
jgi:hypothetical protein